MAKKTDKPEPTEPTPPAVAIPLRWVRVSHHSPDHLAARYLYAAYGSNLNLGQMATRCQGADIAGSGVLRNARLVFARYLGIVEDDSATVPVGVFKVTAADIAALDRYEGLGRSYERFLVTVELNGEAVRCFTYIKRNNEPEQPSEKYWEACSQGYADFNFDSRRLRHARDFARKNERPKKYGKGYQDSAYGTESGMDWRDYMESGKRAATRGNPNIRNYMVPSVPATDGSDIGPPKTSLVTGRQLAASWRDRHAPRQTSDQWDRNHPKPKAANGNARKEGLANAGYKPGDEFINPKTGETWRMGGNGVWLRKEA